MSPRKPPSGRSPARPVKRAGRGKTPAAPASWTFLSNHAHVLLCLSRGDDPRLRDVAERVGVTERAVQKIVLDLEREGILTRHRDGRRNIYELDLERPLRHPLESHRSIRDLVDLVQARGGPRGARSART